MKYFHLLVLNTPHHYILGLNVVLLLHYTYLVIFFSLHAVLICGDIMRMSFILFISL